MANKRNEEDFHETKTIELRICLRIDNTTSIILSLTIRLEDGNQSCRHFRMLFLTKLLVKHIMSVRFTDAGLLCQIPVFLTPFETMKEDSVCRTTESSTVNFYNLGHCFHFLHT